MKARPGSQASCLRQKILLAIGMLLAILRRDSPLDVRLSLTIYRPQLFKPMKYLQAIKSIAGEYSKC